MATKQFETSPKNVGKIFPIASKANEMEANFVTAPQNLVTYFNFGYYFGIIPFRIGVEQGHPGGFVVHTNLFQRMVCAIRIGVTVLLYLYAVTGHLFRKREGSSRIIFYFSVLRTLTLLLANVSFIAKVWSHKGQVGAVNLLRNSWQYENSFRKPYKGSVFGNVWVSRIICLIGAIMSVLGSLLKLETKKAGPCTLARSLAEDAKIFWSFGNYAGNCTHSLNATQGGISTSTSSPEWWDIALLCFDFFAKQSGQISMIAVVSGICVFVLHLNHGTESFVKQLRRNGGKPKNREERWLGVLREKDASFDILQITEQFRKLKKLSDMMNEIISATVFFFWISTLLFLASALDAMLTEHGWVRRLVNLYYILFCITVFWKAAEVCEKMDEFRSFLVQKNLPIGFEKRILLLEELATAPVGIRGLKKFVIDTKFLTNMATLLITLIVVMIQNQP